MQKVKIVTHSGCDLAYGELEKYNVTMIPDWIIIDDNEYRNNIDIYPDTFYARLEESENLPTSSHPSPAEFEDAFISASQYEDIIFIALSSKLTGTFNTASLVAQQLKEDGFGPSIHIFDSCQASFGAALIVLEAARLAQDGHEAEYIISHLNELVPRIGVFFVMNTLKYAYKGGRIGAVSAIAAKTLGIKPLLVFQDGTVKDLSLNRTFNEGIRSVYKRYQTLTSDDQDVIIFHACNEAGALRLKNMIQKDYPHIEPRIEFIGPVIGLYTGTGCVGIAFKKKEF